MATREEVMAAINLFAVLRSIQELVALDAESQALVEGTDITVEFVVRGSFRGALRFSGGACEFVEGRTDKVDIRLFFLSPLHLNRMVEGKAKPIPLKGLMKIGFLTGPFTSLTDRLSHFLQPEEGASSEPGFDTINTRLTAFVAFHAVSEVANRDDLGRASAAQVPDGVMQVKVEEDGGLAMAITAAGGRLSTRTGIDPDHRCLMWFRDNEALAQLLNGDLEAFSIFAQGRAGIRGFVPMADKINPILGLLPAYLE